MTKTHQQLLVEQLESSVEFLAYERSKHAVASPEYHKLAKEHAVALFQLTRERLK